MGTTPSGLVLLSTKSHAPSQLIYDPLNSINESGDNNRSLVARHPRLVTIEGLAAGTTVEIKVKLDDAAQEIVFATFDGATESEGLVEFLEPYNFLVVERTGADDFKAFAQYGNEHKG